ncbi:zinc-binding alcohol dehydrogenase family protein [Kocuria oceani]|uniref:Zinc-type alcohol dehydrogenase-like protein n=1 Tax=Kocuria oceani TaxID=988827 RepID=A0ABV9TGV5_9MICC|nr:zinc-binding alcohol dehydrogenase family protein [Kocuria oceani]
MTSPQPAVTTTTAYLAQAGRELDDPGAFLTSTVTIPDLRPHDLLVRVHAVSVNPVDIKSRDAMSSGTRQLGWDASGVVEAVGSAVTRFTVEDEVWYAGDITRPGTNADLHAVDERIVGHKPTTLEHPAAAALPLTAITAWESLFDRFRLTADSTGTLLVVGAPGGVGSILIQLAKKFTGLTVIATAARPETREWVVSLGADHVVDHRNLTEETQDLVPEGVDYVFTAHSAGNVQAFAEITKPFAQITAIDDPDALDLLPLKAKSITWHWELMFTRSMFATSDMIEQGNLLDEVARLVDDGTVRSTVTTVIPGLDAEGLRAAHQLVAAGTAIGKIVVSRHRD